MEPFSIQCESCHAKLKVTKASLIGQSLPCPKCQSTILVPSPEPTPAQDPATVPDDAQAHSTISGGFEDVDQLLSQQAQSPTPSPSKPPVPAASRPTKPLNPAEQAWDNPAATHTRRILGWSAGLLGATLFLAVGGYAWWSQSSTPSLSNNQSAANDSPAVQTNEPKSMAAAELAQSKADNKAPTQAAIETPTKTPDGSLPSTVPATSPPPVGTTTPNETASAIVGDKPPPLASTAPTPSQPPAITSPLAGRSPIDTGSVPPSAGPTQRPAPTSGAGVLKPVSAAKSSLSELSSLLEESGSSISAITDATAAIAATDSIGLPKYFFQPERSAPVNVQRQLSQPCVGLNYNDVALMEILRDITTICGVPITIDTSALVGATNANRLIPTVSVNVNNTDFLEAIERTVSPLGWTAFATETGVVVTHADAAKPSATEIDLTRIAQLGDEGLDGMVDAMKAMIAPESWSAAADDFHLRRDGMTLTVQHVPFVQRAVNSFVSRTAAGIELASGNAADPAKLRQQLSTVLADASDSLESTCDLEITSRGSLDDLLGRVKSKTGVDVIANWETLATLGWTPRLTVPGDVSEPTLNETLRQLTRSTKSTAIVLDANTVELTSPTDAAQRSTVEFYLIDDLLENRFTAERTLQLIQEAIENALTRAASTTIYEPSCRCIIIAAPQSTHRVVETVIGQLRRLD